MSFLHNNESEYIASRITNKGRQKIAEGNFNIVYFQVGYSEFDYNFSEFDGTDDNARPSQKIFTPLDKFSTVKYPYKLSESPITGTTFGNPIQTAQIDAIRNNIGAAGFVSQYIEYSGGTGTTIQCDSNEIPYTSLDGTNILTVTSGANFATGTTITIAFTALVGGENGMISENCTSLSYMVTNISGNDLTLDKPTPIISSYSGEITVIPNDCVAPTGSTGCYANTEQQDPWEMDIVWTQKPAGLDVPTTVDEGLTGYTSNIFVSTKEFLGYTTSSGQTENTGTTISDTFGNLINVLPEEQHSIAILHYSRPSTTEEPDKFFKYEDYIAHEYEEDINYFEVYIPFFLYHRNSATGTTFGARFFMDSVDYFINSAASDTKQNKLKFRYLIDEQDVKVGKIFVDNKIIVFDDQEIVAALDYKSNRRHTLPIPSASQQITLEPTPLMSGTTGETVFISYLFEMTGHTGMNSLHCNHYAKITGTTSNADALIRFATDDFQFMKANVIDYKIGYLANKFSILVQKVQAGTQPLSNEWKIIDFTSEIPNHVSGYINPVNMRGSRFLVTNQQYEDASYYDLESYLGPLPDEPSTDPEFGDIQPFPGSIKLTRATDLHVMRFLVNLPEGQFDTTQNPTWTSGKTKKITEIALLDENKDVLVVGKTPKPISRVGTQVYAVKLDL